ncbi:MAG TPA: metal ABC transporter ATP-binding protein [Gaiellaceae bacterium]|nr:metal ABC transporter ATP-binding protein [Gaiellaceae bacterium]
MPLAVELRNVSFGYPGGPPVLRDVDLEVRAGEFLAIAGPNGGGKTTLLRLALGLEHPTSGEALLFGEPADRVGDRHRIGYLAQRTRLGIDAPATVSEVVAAGRVARRGLLRPFRREDREAVAASIARVGLLDLAKVPIQRLSGGQQQRAYIAKALAGEPQLLVLDEPTAGVDVDAQEAFGAFLGELHQALGVTILYVSHEFGAVEHLVERVILVRGAIVFDGSPADLPAHWHDPSHVHP